MQRPRMDHWLDPATFLVMAYNKYGAIKVKLDGYVFDSKLEAARYKFLRELETAGAVSDIEVHPPFPCFVEGKKICLYKADFKYKNAQGEEVVEDTKGIQTDVFKLKKKLVEALYPGLEIQVISSPRA
jgi:hypothetical protein